jgi:predicted RNase H-like nuclease (RuvC/YqgF family)
MVENLNKKNMELASANEKYKISISTFEKNFTKYQEMEKDIINLRKDLKDKEEKIA